MSWADVDYDLMDAVDGLRIAYNKLAHSADFTEGTGIGNKVQQLIDSIDGMQDKIKNLRAEVRREWEV
jgi:hypothetical protein